MKDPIVAEVRKVRDEHARLFHYDLDAICNDLIASQRRGGRLLVNRSSLFKKGKGSELSEADLDGLEGEISDQKIAEGMHEKTTNLC